MGWAGLGRFESNMSAGPSAFKNVGLFLQTGPAVSPPYSLVLSVRFISHSNSILIS